MDLRPVGLWSLILRCGKRRRVQTQFQRLIAQILGQRPIRPARLARRMQSPAAVTPIDRLAAILRLDMPPARSLSTSRILRMGNLCPGMPCSLSKESRQCRFADHPTAPVTPVHSLVAIARNGWSRSIGTNVAINRNRWSQSAGTRINETTTEAGRECPWAVTMNVRTRSAVSD